MMTPVWEEHNQYRDPSSADHDAVGADGGGVVVQQSLDTRGWQSQKSSHGEGGGHSHGTCGAPGLHSMRMAVVTGYVEVVDL